jgi:hypothetical protein
MLIILVAECKIQSESQDNEYEERVDREHQVVCNHQSKGRGIVHSERYSGLARLRVDVQANAEDRRTVFGSYTFRAVSSRKMCEAGCSEKYIPGSVQWARRLWL